MAAQYYIVASLPMLIGPHQTSPMSYEDFLDAARPFLNEEENHSLVATRLEPSTDAPEGLATCFSQWEMSLRNDLVRLRAAQAGLVASSMLREGEPVLGTLDIAQEAMAASSPLEAELILDKERWQFIDELQTPHHFNMEFLRGYSLKLQILERHARFQEDEGFAAYRDIYARVLGAAGTAVPMGGMNG